MFGSHAAYLNVSNDESCANVVFDNPAPCAFEYLTPHTSSEHTRSTETRRDVLAG